MSGANSPLATDAPAVLTALLREVGARAALFAELLCGDARQGEVALAQTVQALGDELLHAPVADCRLRFWALLVAAPALREPLRDPGWPAGPLTVLGGLGVGVRAALLLRVVAQLDDATAAAALVVTPAVHRAALRRAVPPTSSGMLDATAWQGLQAACDRRLRAGADPRSGRLDRLFALAAEPGKRAVVHWPGLPAALWTGVALCLLGLVATLFVDRRDWAREPQIKAIALPVAAEPASRFDADTAVLTHRDFDALANPQEQPLAQDLGLYAWYAAQVAPEGGAPLLFPYAAQPGASEPVDAPATALPPILQARLTQLPSGEQHQLLAHEAIWESLTPLQQRSLRQRMSDWDAQPLA
ncbi:MAG: sigma-70, region 4 family protein, partial [Xanthomonadaceae bacterium]|nr:sigma-70, region 4 family protein [Xanthomonadaceae bacterium]